MKVKVQTPKVPNYVRIEAGDGELMMSIALIADEDLDALAKDWRFALYERRDELRKLQKLAEQEEKQ